jgi:hypothetical protein
MTPAADILDGDEATYAEVYNKGYDHGYSMAAVALGEVGIVRRERWIATAWFVAGLVAGVYGHGWLA